jgi:hypothetical protein
MDGLFRSSEMLRGHIDVLLSAGYIHGWAFDSDRPEKPLNVLITDKAGSIVASGLAHHYREDLVEAGCGVGWCEFRLRVSSVSSLRRQALTLVEAQSRLEIARADKIAYQESGEIDVRSVEKLILTDPTMTYHVDQLKGCDGLFRNFIRERGVEAFVRAAYVYMLARQADPSGLKRYGRMIRTGALSPFALLGILADSEEFRSRPRLLGAPTAAAFALSCG